MTSDQFEKLLEEMAVVIDTLARIHTILEQEAIRGVDNE